VELKGSGQATLNVLKRVEATLRGSGSVTVFGNPSERSISRTGSGDVEFR
jgi:hypothetical protein